MKLHASLLASAALVGAAVLASPAFAIQQIHIPNSSAAQNSGPPDALFDKSVPTSWQKNADEKKAGDGFGNFHFSVGGGSGGSPQTQSSGFGNAGTPGSEFRQNGQPVYQDPYAPR